jgi:hypothetical protein
MAEEVGKGKIQMQVIPAMSTDEASAFGYLCQKWGMSFNHSTVHFKELNEHPESLFPALLQRAKQAKAGGYEIEFFTLYPFVLDYEESDWIELLQPQLNREWSEEATNTLGMIVNAYVNEKLNLKLMLVIAKELHLFGNQSVQASSMSHPLINLKLHTTSRTGLDVSILKTMKHVHEEFVPFMLTKWTE